MSNVYNIHNIHTYARSKYEKNTTRLRDERHEKNLTYPMVGGARTIAGPFIVAF